MSLESSGACNAPESQLTLENSSKKAFGSSSLTLVFSSREGMLDDGGERESAILTSGLASFKSHQELGASDIKSTSLPDMIASFTCDLNSRAYVANNSESLHTSDSYIHARISRSKGRGIFVGSILQDFRATITHTCTKSRLPPRSTKEQQLSMRDRNICLAIAVLESLKSS